MHLDAIKLAGFKSFADPTTIKFMSNLTAIVGPNGCGKSNVVDAVRWVIGESSAKNLRAESMADVIFNGTTNRKPVAQSSIELSFDNSDGTVGGEYAGYNNISVRRILQRDGQSVYFLNGTRCRRKDILDIFLGTGLGPRSYSIIEQGMISKIIEAKPEDLRVYLEEAAGISKYKERRRETENRIRHTQDNLDRLTDLREELGTQLAKLKRQANAAERYKEYQAELRQSKAELDTLEWKRLNDMMVQIAESIRAEELALEALLTDMGRHDTDIEQLRIQHTDATDEFNTVQSMYYSHRTEIAKLEQQISHTEERIKQINDDLRQIKEQLSDIERHLLGDQTQLGEIQGEISKLEEISSEYKSTSEQSQEELFLAEEKLQEWQDNWDAYQSENSQALRQVEVEHTKHEHLLQKSAQLDARKARLQDQINAYNFDAVQEHISAELSAVNQLKEQLDHSHQSVDNINAKIQHHREILSNTRHQLDDCTSQIQKLGGKQSSLEALQQAALGKNDDAHESWLEKFNLSTNSRLGESIHVEENWALAVETVLGEYIEAICVNNLDELKDKLHNISDVNLYFYSKNAHSETNTNKIGATLASKITSDLPIKPLLDDVYLADSHESAFAMLSTLSAHETVITADGVWMSPFWIKIHAKKDEKHGVLQRQDELNRLNAELEHLVTKQSELQSHYNTARETLQALESERDKQQHDYRNLSNQYTQAQTKLTAKETEYQQQHSRVQSLQGEIHEIQMQIEQVLQDQENAKNRLQEAASKESDLLERKEILIQKRDTLKQEAAQIKQKADTDRQKADEMQIRLESTRNQIRYLIQGIERATTQKSDLIQRTQNQSKNLELLQEPLPEHRENLQRLLTDQVDIDKDMTRAKQQLSEIEDQLRHKEKSRHHIEEQIQVLRGQHENARVQQETCRVKCEALENQLREADFDKETLIANIDESKSPAIYKEIINSLESKIQRLGPINLAAIEEHDQISERKDYLDKQNDDLIEALETLQAAIRKIDKETKTKFKETFDAVNATLADYFPRIFGGGNACLELVGEDLLDTGVVVKAQPPGKRNTTIHLLSGGEKALTAIALVFSFFQLNPAPFCILDEVDAPLDDANVIRFCNLVKGMSEKVQFIIISHNKITIEMAKQLAGVTMQEPGVSRLVQVDIDEAIAMATTED